ncbi:MAG: hypothetical protein IBX64_10785 [Actinobacteria bacterium]|nr:hypothetical protein [Actinomycetota bacterium]
MKVLSVFVFFLTFYKIPFFYPYFYISIIFGLIGLSLFYFKTYRSKFFSSIGLLPIFFLAFLILYSLIIDLFSGGLVLDLKNSFSVRGLTLILISALPAYFIVAYCLKWNYRSAIDVIALAFWVQAAFWILSYLFPNLKFVFNAFMGGGDEAVNLMPHNFETRGFGISSEINYTTPFMTVLTCFLLIQRKSLSFVSTLTQLINSNLVVISVAFGFIFSKFRLFYKFIFLAIVLSFIYAFGEVFFPRLIAEFLSGDSRTIRALMNNHIIILNNDYFGHVFGGFVYLFRGDLGVSSDIGWVHIYNYGGVFYTLLYLSFLLFLSFSAFGFRFFSLVWFSAGLVLNTKGLLFGPNSYYFVTFMFIFLNYRNGYQRSNS